MARKTKEDAEATRSSILDAAELCFLKKGVARTTLDDSAAQAGHTRGAVYWHFANKLEVFEGVMERVESPFISQLDKIASSNGDQPLQALRQFHVTVFEELTHNAHTRNAVEISYLHCELAEETRPILSREQRGATQFHEHMKEAFSHAKRLKQLRAELDPAVCAMALRCAISGLIREWLLTPQLISLQRDGLAMVDTLLNSFAVESHSTSRRNEPRKVAHRA
ncbi:TetR family transcriptional regulator [Steroidobacter flavus]|uniref:TetR family transcriptional regulator n=1 Tax=Steroidobacter flavus TaxID=1842136 RepID=A0ABV8T5C2_9GAMM